VYFFIFFCSRKIGESASLCLYAERRPMIYNLLQKKKPRQKIIFGSAPAARGIFFMHFPL